MTDNPKRIRLAVFTLLFGCASVAFGHHLEVYGIRPNLGLTAAIVCTLFDGPDFGAVLGLLCGFVEGAYQSSSVGSLAVSRTLVCFGVGAMDNQMYRHTFGMACAVTAVGSFAAEMLYFLSSPQGSALAFLGRAAGSAGLNVVAALLLFPLVRRLVRRRESIIASMAQ